MDSRNSPKHDCLENIWQITPSKMNKDEQTLFICLLRQEPERAFFPAYQNQAENVFEVFVSVSGKKKCIPICFFNSILRRTCTQQGPESEYRYDILNNKRRDKINKTTSLFDSLGTLAIAGDVVTYIKNTTHPKQKRIREDDREALDVLTEQSVNSPTQRPRR